MADINVNIYDISSYHEWQFKRKRKEPKEKEYIISK